MRVCDRLQVLSGTAADFYGYTELNYPTWQLEYWDPTVRPCLVPEPAVLGVADLTDDNRLWSARVNTRARPDRGNRPGAHRAATSARGTYPSSTATTRRTHDHEQLRLRPQRQDQLRGPSSVPSEDLCSNVCGSSGSDVECSEYSAYASQNEFELIMADSSQSHAGPHPG